MTGRNLLLYFLFSLILFNGCKESQPNFLVDEFPKMVTSAWEDKALLKKFKATPFEIAITNHPEYNEAFKKTINKLVLVNEFETNFKNSFEENGLELFDTSNSLLLLALYHKKINNVKFKVAELKVHTDLIYMKKQIIERSKDFTNFQINDCNVKELNAINNWLLDSVNRVKYIDADIVIRASRKSCLSNVEFSQLYNETLFNYLKSKPNDIIELLEEGNYPNEFFELMNEELRNPTSDKIDLDLILKKLKDLTRSRSRNQFINSIEFAVMKR